AITCLCECPRFHGHLGIHCSRQAELVMLITQLRLPLAIRIKYADLSNSPLFRVAVHHTQPTHRPPLHGLVVPETFPPVIDQCLPGENIRQKVSHCVGRDSTDVASHPCDPRPLPRDGFHRSSYL